MALLDLSKGRSFSYTYYIDRPTLKIEPNTYESDGGGALIEAQIDAGIFLVSSFTLAFQGTRSHACLSALFDGRVYFGILVDNRVHDNWVGLISFVSNRCFIFIT